MNAEQEKQAAQGVKVYQAMMETWDASLREPTKRDWPKVMAGYLASGPLAEWRPSYDNAIKFDLRVVGYTTAKAEVMNLPPNAVEIRACNDRTHYVAVDSTGRQLSSRGAKRSAWVMRVELAGNDRWMLVSLRTQTPQGKPLPCDA